MTSLTRLDPTGLAQLNRALIGFDRIFNDMERRYSNSSQNNYPPYNIIQHDDNTYEIELAVAGFDRNDIKIEVDQNLLTIEGQKEPLSEDTSKYIHRGLAARSFERVFTLADHMEVGEAEINNGILRIKINRIIPEALKPRLITIK